MMQCKGIQKKICLRNKCLGHFKYWLLYTRKALASWGNLMCNRSSQICRNSNPIVYPHNTNNIGIYSLLSYLMSYNLILYKFLCKIERLLMGIG